jgi:hypothetical protein
MLYYILAMLGGGDDFPPQPPDIILIPQDDPSWVEIGGLVVAAIGIIVTISIFLIKRKKK